jgi:hypothetical protein
MPMFLFYFFQEWKVKIGYILTSLTIGLQIGFYIMLYVYILLMPFLSQSSHGRNVDITDCKER